MDTLLLGPKGMNGLKILSSTRLVQTNLPTTHQPSSRRHHRSDTQLGSSHPPTPQISRYTPRCRSVVLWTPCSGVEWRVFEPAVKGGKAARRASSLRTLRWRVRRSPCPSSPTTHPPYVPRPSALDHVDRDMLNPTSDLLSHCHHRVYVRCALAEC
jgi:hypothetical protein